MLKQKRVRRLFPEFEVQTKPSEQRSYIEQEMVRLIEDGEFYLTEAMNQRSNVKQWVGDVIFGRGISDGTMGYEQGAYITTFPIHPTIEGHRVEIVSIDGATSIKYADGSRPIEGVIVGQTQRYNVGAVEPNVIDTKQTKLMMALRPAWLCLKEHGEYVAPHPQVRGASNPWLYRETEPADLAEKPKRGRKPSAE